MKSATTVETSHGGRRVGRRGGWMKAGVGGLLPPLSAGLLAFTAGCGSGTTMNPKLAQPVAPAPVTPTITMAIWVANRTNVLEYLPSQLSATSPSMVPHLINNSGAFGAPQGVTFDAAGDLWVIDGGTIAAGRTVKPALYEFTPVQLANLNKVNNPSPNVTNSDSFTFPQQAVFDPTGNLWVSDNGSNAVFVFTPAQLAQTNTAAVPNVSITSNPAFMGPLGITFDALGNLWVANNASTTIFEFKATHLPGVTTGAATDAAVSLIPDVMLSDDGKGSIQAPWALIFDSKGDLFSSNANAPNTIVEFSKNQLGLTGSPTPFVTISPTLVGGTRRSMLQTASRLITLVTWLPSARLRPLEAQSTGRSSSLPEAQYAQASSSSALQPP